MKKSLTITIIILFAQCLSSAEFFLNRNIGEDIDISPAREIAYGDARNDGKNRFYIETGSSVTVVSLLYEVEHTTAGFDKNPIDTDFSITKTSNLILDDIRGDGKKCLYALRSGISFGSAFLAEYEWSGSSWTRNIVAENIGGVFTAAPRAANSTESGSVIRCRTLESADLKGDGAKRLYANTREGKITEYEWNGSSWTQSDITNTAFYSKLIAIDARNDGKKRLYVGVVNGVEMEWLNGEWRFTDISIPAFLFSVGPGRNDGINRIYYKGVDNEYLTELSWEDGVWAKRTYKVDEVRGVEISPGWSRTELETGAAELSVAAVADGRNDGIQRVYLVDHRGLFSGKNNTVMELTWTGSGWDYEGYVIKPDKFLDTKVFNFYLTDTALRNETRAALNKSGVLKTSGTSRPLNKLYTSDLSEYVIAYPQPAYDTAKTARDKLQPVNNYFKRGEGWASMWYSLDDAGSVSLKIYNMRGELVRTLFDGYKSAGEYCEVWTGRNEHGDICSTGVYLVKLVTPRGSITKKICMVK